MYLSLIVVFLAILLVSFVDAYLSSAIDSRKLSVRSLNRLHRLEPLLALRDSDEELDQDDDNRLEFTQKQRLKEETEAPFRTVRFYFYFSLLGAAGLSAFICITKLIAAVNLNNGADLTDLYTNLGINLAGIPVLSFLWKRDLDSRQSLLERIQRGGSLAGLKVKMSVFGQVNVLRLSDLRKGRGVVGGEKRVVIVLATESLIRESVLSSLPLANDLYSNDLLIVPLVIEPLSPTLSSTPSPSSTPAPLSLSTAQLAPFSLSNLPSSADESPFVEHIASPVSLAAWREVLGRELKGAVQQGGEGALERGVTIVMKKNGKVGSRRFGVPLWEGVLGEVQARETRGMDVRNI